MLKILFNIHHILTSRLIRNNGKMLYYIYCYMINYWKSNYNWQEDRN